MRLDDAFKLTEAHEEESGEVLGVVAHGGGDQGRWNILFLGATTDDNDCDCYQ